MAMLNIECSVCNRHYHLPDQNLNPQNGLRAKCSHCNNLIVVNFKADNLPPTSPMDKPWKTRLQKKELYGKALRDEVAANLKKLYPMPHVALKARQLINKDDFDFNQISKLLKTDPALAGRILKVANSAYFGLSGKVSSIQHAAALLGTNLIVQIINMVSHSKLLGRTLRGYKVASGSMWRHALAVAVGSDFISKKMTPELSDKAFLAGLLHDSGKIILDSYIVEREAAFQSLLTQPGVSPVNAEKKVLGFNHAQISGDLCIQWGLPIFVAEAICYHHTPSESRANMLAYIVHAANAIAKKANMETSEIDITDLDANTLNFLQIDERKLQAFARQILETVETLEDDTY